VGEWLQVDLGTESMVSAVFTQGRARDCNQFVKSYIIKTSLEADGEFTSVDDDKVFDGNSNTSTVVKNTFAKPVKARYVRIYPQTWNEHMSLRWDLTFE